MKTITRRLLGITLPLCLCLGCGQQSWQDPKVTDTTTTEPQATTPIATDTSTQTQAPGVVNLAFYVINDNGGKLIGDSDAKGWANEKITPTSQPVAIANGGMGVTLGANDALPPVIHNVHIGDIAVTITNASNATPTVTPTATAAITQPTTVEEALSIAADSNQRLEARAQIVLDVALQALGLMNKAASVLGHLGEGDVTSSVDQKLDAIMEFLKDWKIANDKPDVPLSPGGEG